MTAKMIVTYTLALASLQGTNSRRGERSATSEGSTS